MRRRLRRSSRISRAAASPFATRGRSASFIRTSTPACATAVPAMPDPMKPAPTTPSRRTSTGAGGGRSGVRHPEILLERGGGEEDLDELAGNVGDGELAEQLRLALEPRLEAVLQPVLDGVQRGEGRGIMASGLLLHLLPRRAEHEPPSQRVAVEQPAAESTPPLALRPPATRHATGGGEGDILQDRRVHELVHDAEAERLPGGLDLPGEDDVERGARTDQSRQPLAAARAGEDPELPLRAAELGLGVIGGHAVAAGERELEPAAEASAVNPHGHRLGEARHALEQVLTVGREALRLRGARERDELFDVGARDEVLGLAREERDGLHRRIPLERLERREDVLLDRARDLVHPLAPRIDRDSADPVRAGPAW